VDLALIGNGSYQALIDARGEVCWLCWPRFDSSWVFGSILDRERGGRFAIAPTTAFEAESQYIADTNILRTWLRCEDGEIEITDFAPRWDREGRTLRPRALVRRVRPVHGSPKVRIVCEPVTDLGRERPAAQIGDSSITWHTVQGPLTLASDAPITGIANADGLVVEDPFDLCLSWSGDEAPAPGEECAQALEGTQQHWQEWTANLHTPPLYRDAVVRSALALKLHHYEDTGAFTAAATTSLPEHPGSGRTWDYRFCWFRDAVFTTSALRVIGHDEEAESFLDYAARIAQTQPSRLQPLYDIVGQATLDEIELGHLAGADGTGPVRVGNAAFKQIQNDVYGQLLCAAADSSREEGAMASMRAYLLDRCRHTLEQPDAGVWEKRAEPRLHTFTLLWHWAGAKAAGDDNLASRAAALIEKAWRPELGYFADTIGGDHADASTLMLINLGYLGADDPRANRHVDAIAKALDAGDHLLWRYTHDDGLGETVASFTVCSLWHAEALARLGRHEEGRQILQTILSHRNHVGLLSEDVDPISKALWGNFPQTYSHAGIIHAAFALATADGL